MASAARIRRGIYTDADVMALYMKYRESGIGPFTREVGDFIAHSKRDRGATLDTTAYMFAQLAFFQAYQSDKKQPLLPKGKCGWWLRHYLLTKSKETAEQEIRDAAGVTKKQAKNAIKSWFPDKEIYPTDIKCNDPNMFFALAKHFCRTLVGKNVFDITHVKSELTRIFDVEGIGHGEMDRFIVGTATLLNGKSVEIVPGFTATVNLHIETIRYQPVEIENNTTEMQYVIIFPDGDLTIGVRTENNTGDGLVSVALGFLDTGIDTEVYFSRDLVERDDHKTRLRLRGPFSFDTAQKYPVHETK
jgi:hypothetical protein